MRKIPLTQGKFAIVDDEDYKRINKYKWHTTKDTNVFYAKTHVRVKDENFKIKNKVIGMQMLVLNLTMSSTRKMDIDHRDGDGLNNKKNNLRLATHAQNIMNQRLNKVNTSGYKGVSWHRNKWRAQIKKDGKRHHLGLFTCLIKAAKAYDEAAKELFGEYARLNFPNEDTPCKAG